MKKLIYQYNNSNAEYAQKSKQSIEKYAEQVDADYKFYDGGVPLGNPYYGMFLPFFDSTCYDYDVMCFMDSDILSTTRNGDVFKLSNSNIGVHHMNSGPVRPDKEKAVREFIVASGVDEWKDIGHGNTGVVLFPEEQYEGFVEHLNHLPAMHEIASKNSGPQGHKPLGGFDQYVVNKYTLEHGLNQLPWDFNYHLAQYYHERRFEAQLIHYHGNLKGMLVEEFEREDILK
jgi:hypothetical protein